MTEYTRGQKVRVLPRYNGSGCYGPDGFEGEWYVVKVLPNPYGPRDLLLSRSPDGDGEAYISVQRIDGAPEAAWREDQQS